MLLNDSINFFSGLVIAGKGGRAVYCVGLGRLFTEIVVSNPARGMNVCICVSVLCCPV
jgi:hypothetical protein